jgi:hypothetical protein
MGNTPLAMKCPKCVRVSPTNERYVKIVTGAPFIPTGRSKATVRVRRRYPTFRGFSREFLCTNGHTFWSIHHDGEHLAHRHPAPPPGAAPTQEEG